MDPKCKLNNYIILVDVLRNRLYRPKVLCVSFITLYRHHKPPSQTKTCHLVLWKFCCPYIFTLFIGHFHPEAIESWQRHVMASIFVYGKHFWLCIQKLGKYCFVCCHSHCWLFTKTRKYSRQRQFFIVLSSMLVALCTKMHIKDIFLSIPVILEKFMPCFRAFSNTAVE